MTGILGFFVLACTAYLSFKYRPSGKDSFILLGLCLFCGMVSLMSGVDRVGVMNAGSAVMGIVMLLLYRGQLRAQTAVKENPAEAMKIVREDEFAAGRTRAFARQSHEHHVA